MAQCNCFRVKHAIVGDNKGNKGVVALVTFVWACVLLFIFKGNSAFLRVFVDTDLGIKV